MTPDVHIVEDTQPSFAEYARVPIAFTVREVFDVVAAGGGAAVSLVARPVDHPWLKDYDAVPAHHPTDWPRRFDVSRWGVLSAWRGDARVGGAVIVWDAPGVDMLRGRADLAVLWDLRVAPEARGQGIGRALFDAAAQWAAVRGARALEVETQNVNVPACRFYEGRGCRLRAVDRAAYPELPGEVQLLWYKEIAPR